MQNPGSIPGSRSLISIQNYSFGVIIDYYDMWSLEKVQAIMVIHNLKKNEMKPLKD